MRGTRKTLWLAGLLALSAGARGDVLSLKDYLAQVKQGNQAIRAALDTNASLELADTQVLTAFSPQFNAVAEYMDSQVPQQVAFESFHTYSGNLNLGLSDLLPTGTKLSLGYQSSESMLEYLAGGLDTASVPAGLAGLLSAFAPQNPFYTVNPSLTVTQSLWKGWLAGGVRAQQRQVMSGARAAQALNRFQVGRILFQAEQAYYNLVLAQDALGIQQESLDRANKILDWAQRRAASNLGNQVDVLASKAAVEQAEIGLAQAQQDLSDARRGFDSLRGLSGAASSVELEPLVQPSAALRRTGDREDLVAARFDLDQRRAEVDVAADQYTPDLKVFGTLSLDGGAGDYPDAQGLGWSTGNLSTAVGVNFSMNLDLPLFLRTMKGARLARQSGQEALDQKRRDLDDDWALLEEHWRNVRQRLAIADDLEALQKDKADREKRRFENGLSTNFQVLQYENDYTQARLMRLKLVAEASILKAEADFYNGNGI